MTLGLHTDTSLPAATGAESMAPLPGGAKPAAASEGLGGAATDAPREEPTTSSPHAFFGQLMAQALRQQARPVGTDGLAPSPEPSTWPDAATLQNAAQLSAESVAAPTADSVEDTQSAKPAPDMATLALPAGLPLWPDPLRLQHVAVGPSLQAITAQTPPPDVASLTAFAHRQGLTPEAIGMLMASRTESSANAPSGANTFTSAAVTSAFSDLPLAQGQGLAWPMPAAASTANTVPAQPMSSLPMWPGAAVAPATPAAASTQARPVEGAMNLLPSAFPHAAAMAMPSPASGASAPLPRASPSAEAIALAAPLESGRDQGLVGPAFGQPLGNTLWSHGQAVQGRAQDDGAWQLGTLDLSPDGVARAQAASAQALAANSPAAGADTSNDPRMGDGANLGAPSSAHNLTGSTSTSAALARPPQEQGTLVLSGPAAGALKSSEQMQRLSEKMADAIGERMLREIERGHWNLRLTLKPAQLGHIEVEMRLRAGELDATFAAPQAATRDLLQDGLARLRDNLTSAGMDVASLDIRNGQNRQNGGDSTPWQGQFAKSSKTSPERNAPAPAAESSHLARPRRADGWDVMV